MKPRQRRLAFVAGGIAALGIAAALVFSALESNLVFFFTPTQVAAKEAPVDRTFRVGGLVEAGSVKRQPLKSCASVSKRRSCGVPRWTPNESTLMSRATRSS